jgi:DHA1 family tetracycline resistance protein-like MFS transporter
MLLPIFLIVLVDIFAFTLVIPLLAIYAEHLGATPFEATLLVSIFAVCQLISGPLLGRISDRIGRKPMLLLSQVGTCIGLLVMANAGSLWLLYVARVIDGATAGNLSLAQAYISDNTAPENRARSFGLIGIAFGLGFFLGPSVTGYLVQFGLRAPIFAAAGLSFASILCTALLLPNQQPPALAAAGNAAAGPAGKRLAIFEWSIYVQYLERPVLGALLGQMLLFGFAFTTFTSGFALFAERTFSWNGHPFTPREIGYLFAYAGFLGIILQGGLIGRLVKQFGEPTLVGAGFVSMSVAYVLLGMSHEIGPLLVVATLAAFGQGVLRPTLTSLITQNAARTEQGVVLGLSTSLMSIAQIFAPPLGGWLIGSGHLSMWAFVAATAAGFGLLAAPWGSARAHAVVPSGQAAES